ncbi:TPA: hypothetical protein NDT40_005232 [Klebsiella oxytoca]|nr:hypothetical protein [Klebsiella oxytoca]
MKLTLSYSGSKASSIAIYMLFGGVVFKYSPTPEIFLFLVFVIGIIFGLTVRRQKEVK